MKDPLHLKVWVEHSTAISSDNSGSIGTQSTSPNSSLLSLIMGQNYRSSTSGMDSDGFSKSGGQNEAQNSTVSSRYTFRYSTIQVFNHWTYCKLLMIADKRSP